MKKIIDCTTGEVVERELNKAEKDQQKIDALVVANESAERQEKESAKTAILDRLGLTADELKTILG
jgi:3-hydroxy-3-methylglutaryl CoA synthase